MRKITLLMALLFAFSWQSSAQITTYPYLEDFEGGAGGWTVTGGLWALGTPSGAVINSAAGGVNSWATNLTGLYPNNSNAWVTSPVFDFTAVPNPYIAASIWWDSEFSWDGTVLQSSINGGATWQNVGALGDPNWYTDGSINGNPGGQQIGWSASPGSLGWINASHDLTGLGGQSAVLLRFAFGSDGSVQDDGFAFDNINIVNLTCPAPTALTATSILDVSADLTWTEAGTATSWNIEWGPTGFVQGTGTMVTGTGSNPYSLIGLTPITSYSYYVQADCGGGDLSFWSGPYTFLTACGLIVPAWTDNIEAHTTSTLFTNSNCWNASASTGVYDWNITGTGTTPSSGTGASAAHSGTKYFYTEASGAAIGAFCTLESPVMDASAMTIPTLKFWYHMTGNQMGSLSVEAWDGSAWNQVATINGEQQQAETDAFLEKLVYLPGYNNLGLQVRFIATSAGSFEGDLCIDDISITEAPTCPAPDPFSVVSSDLTSGTFDWVLTPISTETEWELEYGPVGFVPGNGTIMGTTNNPETVTGLASNSFYEIYVQSVCGLGDSSLLVGPLLFNTYNQGIFMESDAECGPGFIDISNSGTPLGLLYAGEMDYTMPFPFLYQGSLVQNIAFTSSGYIMLEAAPGQFSATFNQTMANAIYWGLFPLWEGLEIEQAGMNQYYETIGTPGNQTFIVQWNTNYLNGPAGEDVTFQLQIEEATGEIYFIYDDVIFGGSDYLFDNGLSSTIGVAGPNQDIQLSYNNATYLENNSCAHFYYTNCPKPINFSVVYATTDEGAVTWGSGLAGETNWTVIYGEAGFDPAMTGTTVNTSTPALIMPGLNDITCYDVYIYAECGPSLTSNGYMGTFCTLPNCANPTGITTSTLVDTVMTNWAFTENLGYPSTGFGVQYGWSGFTPGNGTTVWVDNNFTDTTADMTLMGGGVYQMYVQAVCGTDSSGWMGPVSFTMPLTNDSTCFAEELAVDGTLYTFNNAGATIDVGENTITPPATGCETQDGWCNTNLNKSVWYTFVAPASGNVRVNCAGLTFDGQVAAYEVTDCNDFGTYTLIGANDDAPGGYNPPLMNLCGLTPGMTYYLMYDSFSTTATGTYNVTVTDVVVQAGTDNGLTNICRGGIADLFNNISGNDAGGVWTETIPTATFNDPYFATNGLASQVFEFEYTVVDGCASDSVTTTIEIYSPSSAGVDGSITTCMNQPISLVQGLSGNVDLGGSWYDPSNTLLGSPDIIASSIPGQFNYDYVTGNGVCPDDTANVVVIVDFNCDYLNLQEMYFDAMNIHPNPTTGMVYISNAGSNEVFNIELTDLNGKVIATQDGSINGTETTEVSLGNLETGIYLIRIFNDNAEKTFRIVKQ